MKRAGPIRIFVSYSHTDRDWFGKVQPLLNFKTTTVLAHAWHDQELMAGDRWEDEIREELRQMDIFLCLVIYHFMASKFIDEVEMTEALSREKQKKTIIVPLILCEMDDRDIQHLKPFNPLPAWGRSWRSYERDGGNTMDAYKPIRSGLLDAVEKVAAIRQKVRAS